MQRSKRTNHQPSLTKKQIADQFKEILNRETRKANLKKRDEPKLQPLADKNKYSLNTSIASKALTAVYNVGVLSIIKGSVKFVPFVRDVLAITRAVGIDDADVKPLLKFVYGSISGDPESCNVSEVLADQMDTPANVRKANLDEIIGGEKVPCTSDNTESDIRDGASISKNQDARNERR
ncbi:TPA: hypothetical protein NJ652_001230 [Vibrio parahaemolyticus]|nr:hypothetical protein [Vibrio parahaemolyticus]